MAKTAYPTEKMFVPVECEKVAFEEFSLSDVANIISEVDATVAEEKLVINDVEKLNIQENLLDDFSRVDLKKEVVDIRNFERKACKKKSIKKRIMNILNTDVAAPLNDILNTDVSSSLQELMTVDLATPLQEVFDNLITMISTNKQD